MVVGLGGIMKAIDKSIYGNKGEEYFMSDFSLKCKTHLLEGGYNVYQLAASSGLDRTTLQRMITGKRLPGLDFMNNFCASLRINPLAKKELLELYTIEKIGKATYNNRICIRTFLEYLAALETDSGHIFPDNIKNIFPQVFLSMSVETQIVQVLNSCFQTSVDSEICTNLPHNCTTLFNILSKLHSKYKHMIPIKHIFTLQQNPAAFENANINLEILYNLLPFGFSSYTKYYPHFYYSKTSDFDINMQVYPYFLIVPSLVLLISADLTSTIVQTNPLSIASYKNDFEKTFRLSTPLLEHMDDPNMLAEYYSNRIETYGIPSYTLEPHPCLQSMIYSTDVLSELFADNLTGKNAILQKFSVHHTSFKDFCKNNKNIFHNFFTLEGLNHFVNTGEFSGQLKPFSRPLGMKHRKRMLEYLLYGSHDACQHHLLKNTLVCPENIYIELFHDLSLHFTYLGQDNSFRQIFLSESSIGSAFNDFFEALNTIEITYTQEEMTTIIENYIHELDT